VNFSHALKWSVVLLAPLTLAWKVAIPPTGYHPDHSRQAISEFLERNGFDVVVSAEYVNYEAIIRATRASCRLVIAELTPDGSNRDLIRALVGDTDRHLVVFRGNLYAQQPITSTVIHSLWSKFLRGLGLIRDIRPVLAVGANSTCDIEAMPWSELAR